MTEFGYAGEILSIDLSDGKVTRLPSADYTDKFIGGHGIAARLYWEMVPPEAKAFDPENALICAGGPVMGFPGFAGFRWKICGKSPLGDRESFSHCNLGERWGAFLKYAGYDALAIQGKAERPVYIYINDGKVEIRDAAHLWGKSTFDVIDSLKTALGKGVSVLAIGPAAENLVSYASVLTDDGASGSGGLGAVMGSKMLKAVAVAGDKRPKAADPDRLRQLADRIRAMRPKTGMPNPWAVPGLTRDHACYGCGIGCSRQSYRDETGRLYKSLCQASSFYSGPVMKYFGKWNEAQMLATRLCDGYGLDTAVMHGQIAWLDACYQEGLLSEKETGLPLSRIGSAEFIETLTSKIALREGFGDMLARGTIETAEAVGDKAKKLLSGFIATRGSETKDYDPRLMMTTALIYATEPRRPIQQLHEVVSPLMMWLGMGGGGPGKNFTSEQFRNAALNLWGSATAADFSTYEDKALAAKKLQDRVFAKESLVLCDLHWTMILPFRRGDGTDGAVRESQVYSAITGKEIDEAGLYQIGERIFNLQRAILLRQGWAGRRGDQLLDYYHTVPLKKGEIFFNHDGLVPGRDGEVISRIGAVVDRDEFEKMKSEYYELRGWDASGLPTKGKLAELQLGDIAADLQKRGLVK